MNSSSKHANRITRSQEELNEDARAANMARAQWRLKVHTGQLSPVDAIYQIVEKQDRAGMRITLRSLFVDAPGWGRRRTEELMDHIQKVADSPSAPRRMTIAWLINPNSGGRRWEALLDGVSRRQEETAPGFPFRQVERTP